MRDVVPSFLSDFEFEEPQPRLVDRLRTWGSSLSGQPRRTADSTSDTQETITQLQGVLSNPVVRDRLRGSFPNVVAAQT